VTRAEAMLKVKLLFALADRAGTPGESAAAAGRAQAIMDQWELTREETEAGDADAMVSTLDMRDGWIDTEGKQSLWKHRLIGELARLNGCAAFIGYRGKGRSYEVSGRRAAVDTVRSLYGWIAREIHRMSRKMRGCGLRYANSFRFGMVEKVAERMVLARHLEVERAREAAHNPAALVRIGAALERMQNSGAALAWMRQRPEVEVRDRPAAFEEPDPLARMEGRVAGLRLDLAGPAKLGEGRD
jgi:hypothetical protein